MPIKSITIENFKGFNSKTTGPFSLDNLNTGLNLLVGHPNTGKTTVLDAVLFGLRHPPNREFTQDYQLWHRGKPRFQKLRDFEKLYPFNSREEELRISIETHQGDKQHCHAVWQTDGFDREVLVITDQAETQDSNDRPQRVVPLSESDDSNEGFKSLLESLGEKFLNERSLNELLGQETVNIQETFNIDENFKSIDISYRAFSGNLSPTLEDQVLEILKDLGTEKRIGEFLLTFIPTFKEMRLNGNELIFYDAQNRKIPLSYMGTGFIKVTKLILPLFAFPNQVFLIDEIADSLHPESILQFLHILLPLIRERNIQIIATSHSFDLLNVLVQNYEQFEEFHDLLQIHRFLYRDGKIKIKQNSLEDIQNIFPDFVDVRTR